MVGMKTSDPESYCMAVHTLLVPPSDALRSPYVGGRASQCMYHPVLFGRGSRVENRKENLKKCAQVDALEWTEMGHRYRHRNHPAQSIALSVALRYGCIELSDVNSTPAQDFHKHRKCQADLANGKRATRRANIVRCTVEAFSRLLAYLLCIAAAGTRHLGRPTSERFTTCRVFLELQCPCTASSLYTLAGSLSQVGSFLRALRNP